MPYGLLISHVLVLSIAAMLMRTDGPPPPMAVRIFAAMRIDGVLFLAVTPAFFLSDSPQAGMASLWSALTLLVAGAVLYDRETHRVAWLKLLSVPEPDAQREPESGGQGRRPGPLPPEPLPPNVILFRRRK